MEMFDVKQKKIDQVKKKEELKSINPLKVNKTKRKQKDIIMKLIENLPNHLKDKNEYLLKLKDSIDILITCIKCRKYGHHVTKCEKWEKANKGKDKKEKTKKKQDGIDIKSVTLQDLMTEAKIVKQEIKEIKEDNSTNIDDQNIAKIVNLKDFPKTFTDSLVIGIMMANSPDSPIDKEVTDINISNNNKIDSNRQNFLSLIDKVIIKEFSLREIALTNSGADNMNCIQNGLIPLKYYGKYSERLIQANREELIVYRVKVAGYYILGTKLKLIS